MWRGRLQGSRRDSHFGRDWCGSVERPHRIGEVHLQERPANLLNYRDPGTAAIEECPTDADLRAPGRGGRLGNGAGPSDCRGGGDAAVRRRKSSSAGNGTWGPQGPRGLALSVHGQQPNNLSAAVSSADGVHNMRQQHRDQYRIGHAIMRSLLHH